MKKKFCLLFAFLLCVLQMTGCAPDKFDKQFQNPKKGDTIAVIHTNYGDITVRFFEEEAPKAVENFITHAKEGYYDGLLFHRVIADFMIQSGDPTGTGTGGTSIWDGYFEDEVVEYLSPYRGALCMANTGKANTNGSQFFIVTDEEKDVSRARSGNEKVDSSLKIPKEKLERYEKYGGAIWLDQQVGAVYKEAFSGTQYAHTVFGQVISGMDVADAISQVPVYSELEYTAAIIDDPDQTEVQENKPKEDVVIQTIEITTY